MCAPINRFCFILIFAYVHAYAGVKENYPAPDFDRLNPAALLKLEKEVHKVIPSCLKKLESLFQKPWPRGNSGQPTHLKITVDNFSKSPNWEGSAVTRGHGNVEMLFDAYPLLSGQSDLKTTVCHEMVHAYFRHFLGRFAYAHLPSWAREGSAVYLAGQFRHKLIRALYDDIKDKTPPFNGLLNKNHSLKDYFEDALAFQYLKNNFSPISNQSVEVTFLQLLLEGKKIEEAIKVVTKGQNLETFSAGLKKYSEIYYRDIFDSFTMEMQTYLDFYRQKGASRIKAAPYFFTQLSDQAALFSNPETMTLSLGLSLAFVLDGFGSDLSNQFLINLYEKALKLPSYLYAQNTAALRYRLAALNFQEKNYQRALYYYTLVFNESVELPILQQSATSGILRSYVALEHWPKVLLWSNRSIGLTENDSAEYLYYRGLASFHLKKKENAKDYWSLACQSKASNDFKNKACHSLKSK